MIIYAFNTLILGLTLLPKRIYTLLGHFLFFDLQFPKQSKWWFWFVLIPFKAIDVLLIPELLNLLFSLAKFNSRKLNSIEVTEATKVFGDSLPINKINIDENSIFAWLGAKFNKVKYLGVVTFYSINFNRKLISQPHNFDMEWLIHELTHILQFKKMGSSYIFYALYAQFTDGYKIETLSEKKLNDFNFEQQAEIAKFYYRDLHLSNKQKYNYLKNEIVLLEFS